MKFLLFTVVALLAVVACTDDRNANDRHTDDRSPAKSGDTSASPNTKSPSGTGTPSTLGSDQDRAAINRNREAAGSVRLADGTVRDGTAGVMESDRFASRPAAAKPFTNNSTVGDSAMPTGSNETLRSGNGTTDDTVITTEAKAYAADNSGKNARDQDGDLPTAGNQSETEADRTITQQVRKAVVADDELSIKAKNVKIITVNGTVTLRGPVDTVAERQSIATKAERTVGVLQVDNRLEIAE